MAIGAVNTLSSKWVPPVGAIITTSSSVSPAADYAGTSSVFSWARAAATRSAAQADLRATP